MICRILWVYFDDKNTICIKWVKLTFFSFTLFFCRKKGRIFLGRKWFKSLNTLVCIVLCRCIKCTDRCNYVKKKKLKSSLKKNTTWLTHTRQSKLTFFDTRFFTDWEVSVRHKSLWLKSNFFKNTNEAHHT